MLANQSPKQSGLTLTEALGFLAIMAILVSGALYLFEAANGATVSGRISNDVLAIKASVKASAIRGVPVSAVTTTTLWTIGMLPASLKNNIAMPCSVSLLAPCGVYGDGTAFKLLGGAADFSIYIGNLPVEVCENTILSMGKSGYINMPACVAAGGAYEVNFTYK